MHKSFSRKNPETIWKRLKNGMRRKKPSNLSHFSQTKIPTSNAFKVFLLPPKKPDIHFESPKNTLIFIFHKKKQQHSTFGPPKKRVTIRPPPQKKRPPADLNAMPLLSQSSSLLGLQLFYLFQAASPFVSLCRVVSLLGGIF